MKQLIGTSLLTWALGLQLTCHAQMPEPVMSSIEASMPRPIPSSPNAAALGKFGSYEVSHYTGLPQISIPIFEVKSGTTSIPISLGYHASGIRMLDVASWVGLGWSLSAGGQITRETRGEPDELSYFTDPLIENPEVCGPTANWDYVRNAATEIIDTQPDIFSYSFGSKNGNFMIGHQGEEPFLFPYEAIKVSHNLITNGDLNAFTIVDEDGTIYKFGEGTDGPARESTQVDRTPYYPSVATTGWLLTEVMAPNSDDNIKLSYQMLGYSPTYEPRTSVTVIDNCVGPECPQDGPQLTLFGSNNITSGQMGVKEILFDGGKVEFILSPPRLDQTSLPALDSIKIYSKTGNVYKLVRSVKFIYSYFNYISDPSANVKLKLESIQVISSDGKVESQYRFEYFTNGFSWNQGTVYSKDFWGYYNGKLNDDLIPRQQVEWTPNNQAYQVTSEIGSADRSTVPDFMKEGVLKKITYPTGGYTQFDFETHRYLENEVAQHAAGLRVVSIKSYDGLNPNPVTRTYSYGEGGSGYGVKNFYNSLLYYKSESAIHNLCCVHVGCIGSTTYRQRTFFGNSLIEVDSRDGSPVVYPTVTEYHGDVTSNIGKIVYQYDHGLYIADSLQIILGPQSAKNFKSSYKWKRGKLTRKAVFDRMDRLISETVIEYTLFQKRKKHVGTAAEVFIDYTAQSVCQADCNNEFGDPIDDNQFLYGTYYQMSGALRPSSVVEKLYQNGTLTDALVTSVTSTFDPLYLQAVQRTATSNVSSEVLVTKTLYPFSYAYPGSETGVPNALKKLKIKNVLNAPIEQYVVKENTDGTNARVVSGQITTYTENVHNLDQIKADRIFHWESFALPLFDYTVSHVSNASTLTMDSRYKKRIEFKSYDTKGNITEMKKVDDRSTCYLWAYNQTLAVAEVENCDYDYQPDTEQIYAYGTSFTENFTTDRALTPSLIVEKDQVVTYSIRFVQTGGTTPSTPPFLDVVLKGADGQIVYDPPIYELGTYEATISLPSGTYTLWYHGSANGDATNTVTVRFDVTINYFAQTHHPKIFHTSFEETGIEYAEARTGLRVNNGTYTIKKPTADGDYLLSWWQKTGSQPWTFVQQPLTGGGGTITIGVDGSYLDEVRLHPREAYMTTYTYDLLSGVSSANDENHNVTYYRYDDLGRLHLVLDHDGNILSSYQYHYKNQQ